tara:strand:- start:1132 stop:1410 length:279 start_codon:yes stop_codon:yes gene_type:complete
MSEKRSAYKCVPVDDDENYYTSTGARCKYKIACWKCKKWCYYLFNMDNYGKPETCYECKQEYKQKKERERLEAQGHKFPTQEELDEIDDDDW